jgi:hypothetical protein
VSPPYNQKCLCLVDEKVERLEPLLEICGIGSTERVNNSKAE